MPSPGVALVALLAGAAPFAPADGAHYRVTTVDERGGSVVHRFHYVSRLDFERIAHGWRATLTLVAATSDGPRAAAAHFDAAMRPLLGRAVVYTLDRHGEVVAVDAAAAADLARSYAALAARIPAAARPALEAARARADAALRERLRPLCVPAGTRPGTAPVTLPATNGGALNGTRSVTRSGDAVVIAVAAGGSPLALTTRQEVDAATGITRRYTSERTAGGTLLARTQTNLTAW